VASRVTALIERARTLALERDRAIEALAAEWVRTLRGQGFSPEDLEELWAGLTEEAVRRLSRASTGVDGAVRREAALVIARVRQRVEAELAAGG
jgi:hypothetical protein